MSGMETLLRRFRRPPSTPLTVTLYTRAGCHLCDLARKPLSRFVAVMPGAALRVVDVDSDAALREVYGLRVPVVTTTTVGAATETVLAEGKVSEIRLRRALAALRDGEG